MSRNNEKYVAYLFADNPDAGIKCGKYEGTGTTNFIDCGFDPGWVLIKCYDSTSTNWQVFDNKRVSYLQPNKADAENTTAGVITLGSGGFTLNKNQSDNNSSTPLNYIYVAIAESNPIEVVDVDVASNTMTVDGGDWHDANDWNQSEEWSLNVSTSGTFYTGNTPDKAFNGSIGTAVGDYCSTSTANTNIVVDLTEYSLSGDLEVYAYAASGLLLNGSIPSDQGSSAGWIWHTFPTNSIGTITLRDVPNDSPALSAIKINGALLVDTSVTPTGETQVTAFAALSGTGTFDSFTGTTADLASSNLEWVANDNRLGQTFYMKSDQLTTFMQDNPEHVAIFNAFRDAADQYPLDVNSRRSSVVGAVQRLINGETLEANEAAQVLINVAIGVNAIEPFTYDGYYPLFYTAEKAIAASPQNAYHTHQFDGTNYYMPDDGTMYHGNYVSPKEVEAQHRAANEATYSSATGVTTTGSSSNNSSSY